jgi:hypothetical protein
MIAIQRTPRAAPRQSHGERPSMPAAGRPAPSHGPPPPRQHADRLGATLARAVRRRATQPLLQRAIIAIDGPHDDTVAKNSTRACLANLQAKGGGRGAVAGPDVLTNIVHAPALASPNEKLFILGHGSRFGTVANLTPDAMAQQLKGWYAGQPYTGEIRLVACHSAWTGTESLTDGTLIPVTRSYADRVAQRFADRPSRTFRPSSVQGLLGIGWVRPDSGRQISIDVPEYRALGPLEKADFTTGGQRGFDDTSLLLAGHIHTGAAAKVKYQVPYSKAKDAFGFVKGTADDVFKRIGGFF